jgi:cell division protein FtsL
MEGMQEPQRASQLKPIERREQRQFIAVLVLFVVVSIILGALYLVQATTNVSNSRDIQTLREQRDRIQRENELLKAENAQLASVPRLMERAATLGFVTASVDDIQYMVIDGYVFDQPAPTLTPVQVTATPQIYEENFAGWLKRQTDKLQDIFERWSNE